MYPIKLRERTETQTFMFCLLFG